MILTYSKWSIITSLCSKSSTYAEALKNWFQACDLQFEKVISHIDLGAQSTNQKPDPIFYCGIGFFEYIRIWINNGQLEVKWSENG